MHPNLHSSDGTPDYNHATNSNYLALVTQTQRLFTNPTGVQ